MPSNNPLRYLLVILVLFSIYGKAESQGLPPLTHGLTPVDGGAVAPPLRFRNLDDEWIDIGDFHGKVVIVNFWATWCPPCRREMGSLEKLYQAAGALDRGRAADTAGRAGNQDGNACAHVDSALPAASTRRPRPSGAGAGRPTW